MRVLITVDEGYRLYCDVLAGGWMAMCPTLEVETLASFDIAVTLKSFEPDKVICGGQNMQRSS